MGVKEEAILCMKISLGISSVQDLSLLEFKDTITTDEFEHIMEVRESNNKYSKRQKNKWLKVYILAIDDFEKQKGSALDWGDITYLSHKINELNSLLSD